MELNRIYNMDCLEGLRTLPDGCVDLVVTDPPYLLENTGGGIYASDDKRYVRDLEQIKDGFDLRVLDELCRVLKKVNLYVWCSQRQIPQYLDYFVTRRRCHWNLLSWHKTNPIPACGNKYITDTEYCLFFREPGVRLFGDVDTKGTYYLSPLNADDKRRWGHPTIKPLAFIRRLVRNSCPVGGVVLDPFMGSGTTAVAAVKEERSFLGYEINEAYYKTSIRRIAVESSQLELFGGAAQDTE